MGRHRLHFLHSVSQLPKSPPITAALWMAGDDVEETDGSHVALLRLQPKSKAGYSYSGGRIIFPLHSRLILEIRTLNALVGDDH